MQIQFLEDDLKYKDKAEAAYSEVTSKSFFLQYLLCKTNRLFYC